MRVAPNRNPARRTPEIARGDLPIPGQHVQLRHSAYAIERRIRGDEIDGRTRLGRRVRQMRLGFALALGYPTWTAMPAPVKEAVKNGVRLALFCERLFTPFWAGGEVPQRFFTASENLRRQLSDLGLEPRAPSVDIVAMLAQMRVQEETASIKPAR